MQSKRNIEKQGQGADTLVMLALGAALLLLICIAVLPWYSMPSLKYSGFPDKFTVWNLEQWTKGVEFLVEQGFELQRLPWDGQLEGRISFVIGIGRTGAAILSALLLAFLGYAWKYKKKAAVPGRILLAGTALFSAGIFCCGQYANVLLNAAAEREISFRTMTVDSCLQLTPYAYAQFLISLFLWAFLPRMLNTEYERRPENPGSRSMKKDRGIPKRTMVSLLLIVAVIPAIIWFGIFFLNDRSYYFISLCIIFVSMIPFFMIFEGRNPQAREILLIAVMSAIASAGRVAFFMLPHFKPVTAIVIITGMGLGAEAGFLAGAMSGFASNFFFGQGPWSPWQMFSYGIIGFLSGLIFRRTSLNTKRKKIMVSAFGAFCAVFIYGALLDSASVLMTSSELSRGRFALTYITGFPLNVVHGISTFVFLYFMAEPFLKKLDRVKQKYGILQP